MSTTIYYTAYDNGDGSCSVRFYDSEACIDLLEEKNPESYRGDGGGSFTVDGIITGIDVNSMSDVQEYLENMGLLDEEDEEDEE
jgi:hypothetical protein